MDSPRLLKKYPNRRLYDTRISSYITLEDVRQLVLEGEEFEVRDARTDQDITRIVLLQIIAEREEEGQPMLTANALQLMIRFYGDPLHGFMSRYIERSLQLFLEQQHSLRKQLGGLISNSPFALLNQIAERNLELWKSFQQGVLKGGTLGSGPAAKKARTKTAKGAARKTRA
ncbi:polyhydroxyalkanoate synthesis repressor PhaR [Silanimonas lenta]|jgi:polyhydroxyalkanoate synthesis repressor PhaR|uniref:polyhydroxyalkanoate synthesis repressor PhaR n=1 Tax=Silanimonas lenta TaxID=265429 RepID=UPI00040903A5|nr:polyhydroxyalkanoate synthesis repressor PhaR [Silanimonas lenta]